MTFMGKDEKNLLKDMKNQSNNWRDLFTVFVDRKAQYHKPVLIQNNP